MQMLKCLILKFKQVTLVLSKSIQAWTTFLQCVQKVETKTDILHVRLFGNCNITFQNKPLIFSSFLRSNIKLFKTYGMKTQNNSSIVIYYILS